MRGLALRAVVLRRAGRALFPPLSLDVAPGQVVTLMGPSGCGKSSLLAWLCGTPDPGLTGEGRVLLDGEDTTARPPERRRLGILFQDDLLFPHLSVAGNLGFGLRAGLSRAERQARIAAALAEAEMPGFAARDPAGLSGGQRARVALLRVLLAEPRALLLDEPFGGLDAGLRGRFRRFVLDHAAARALPVLLVTHDAADAEAAGGPVLRLPG